MTIDEFNIGDIIILDSDKWLADFDMWLTFVSPIKGGRVVSACDIGVVIKCYRAASFGEYEVLFGDSLLRLPQSFAKSYMKMVDDNES
jgi:hypothetical protein